MARQIKTLAALRRRVRLTGIVLLRVSGRRWEQNENKPDPEATIQVLFSADAEAIRIRLVATTLTEEAEIIVDLVGVFSFTTPITVSDQLLEQFARSTGVPVLQPYVRSETHLTGNRLGLAHSPLFGLLSEEIESLSEPERLSEGASAVTVGSGASGSDR